jgi:RNA polymerase sigma factor (sigma-70 family)
METTADQRFDALVVDHAPALLAFAMRRVRQPADAVDVVADTLLVAWRRLEVIPGGAPARLWLYGVCRNAVGNHYPGRGRRTQLAERIRSQLPATTVTDPASGVTTRHVVTTAMEALSADDRELLRLIAWEELSPTEAAAVLGIAPANARARLHRARGRLRTALIALGIGDGGPPPIRTSLEPHQKPSNTQEGAHHDR